MRPMIPTLIWKNGNANGRRLRQSRVRLKTSEVSGRNLAGRGAVNQSGPASETPLETSEVYLQKDVRRLPALLAPRRGSRGRATLGSLLPDHNRQEHLRLWRRRREREVGEVIDLHRHQVVDLVDDVRIW